jgi:hypothetical protein
LFCTSCINNNIEGHTAFRYKKWVDYYARLMDQLKVENILLINDGSDALQYMKEFSVTRIPADEPDLFPNALSDVNFFYFKDRLGRPSTMDYPGWWRSFTFISHIAHKYDFDKIIHIESDFFVSGQRLKDYISNLQEGWISLYSHGYNFPESAIQVICKDQLSKFREVEQIVRSVNFNLKNKAAEFILPFTDIRKDFIGDRFGELSVLISWSRLQKSVKDFDYFGQLPTDVKLLSPDQLQRLVNTLSKVDLNNGEACFTEVTDFLSANNLFIIAGDN